MTAISYRLGLRQSWGILPCQLQSTCFFMPGLVVTMNVTSFSSISYWGNSECRSQKQAQSGNIHSIILDVHVGWQSAQNFPLIFLQCKLDKNFKMPGSSSHLAASISIIASQGVFKCLFFHYWNKIKISNNGKIRTRILLIPSPLCWPLDNWGSFLNFVLNFILKNDS